MSIVFLLNGLGIINQAVAAKELLEHGAPASLVPFLMLSARTIQIVAGSSLALGIYPRVAAVAILAFLFPATLTAHAFWQASGTAAFTPQLLNFFKNTAMMGGLLFIAATRSQPTLLPRTARSNSREWIRNEGTSRSAARASWSCAAKPTILGGREQTMKTLDSSDVIQGDEQCRDGHYRAKQDLRTQTVTSTGGGPAAELDPSDSTSLQAQNPRDIGKLKIGRASEEAAGIPAIWNTMVYGIGEVGPLRSSEAFLKINQVTGFDCQSCAWPSPDKKRKIFEFCENGAKALSDESTKKRIGPEFFAQYSISDLAAKSDYWLNEQGRLTSPMVRNAGATHYQPITWPEAFAMIAEELNRLDSPDHACFYTSGKTPMSLPFCCSCLRGSSELTIFRIARTCATSRQELPW
jgi:uncharacterized membrane protein YphA (DoxX/SURF4 family)